MVKRPFRSHESYQQADSATWKRRSRSCEAARTGAHLAASSESELMEPRDVMRSMANPSASGRRLGHFDWLDCVWQAFFSADKIDCVVDSLLVQGDLFWVVPCSAVALLCCQETAVRCWKRALNQRSNSCGNRGSEERKGIVRSCVTLAKLTNGTWVWFSNRW